MRHADAHRVKVRPVARRVETLAISSTHPEG
jgi:hypothetical protein